MPRGATSSHTHAVQNRRFSRQLGLRGNDRRGRLWLEVFVDEVGQDPNLQMWLPLRAHIICMGFESKQGRVGQLARANWQTFIVGTGILDTRS